MQGEEIFHPFDPTGLTPPKGRLGHSVPTPRVLSGEGHLLATNGPVKVLLHQFSGPNAAKLDSWSTATDLHQSGGSGSSSGGSAVSPVQFYAHRDHSFGGSLSKLERMKSLEPPLMEPFDETEEDENVFSDSAGEIDKKYTASPARERSMDHPGGVGVAEPGDGRAVRRKSSSGVGGRSNPSVTLDRLSGDSLLSFSYSATMGGSGSLSSDSQLGSSFIRAFTQGLNSSLSVPGPYLPCTSPTPPVGTSEGSFDQSNLFPTASRNPNKAIVTIDAHTSKILVANEMTCELFGYQRSDLCGMKVQRLFTESYRGKQRALVEQNITASGETRLVSGKVMDAVTSYGVEFPVSVWMRRVDVDSSHPSPASAPSPRVIVVVEPVERSSALFSMSASHKITSCDPWFACLFGFENSPEVIDKHISELVPSLKVPATLQDLPQMPSKQAVTGRAKDGTVFPLTVHYTDLSQCLSVNDLYSPTLGSTHQVSSTESSSSDLAPKQHPIPDNDPHTHSSTSPSSASDHAPPTLEGMKSSSSSTDPDSAACINGKVVVYAALSGMVSFFPDGSIHSCNQHFALMLFGYTQQELQKKDITLLLPDFHHQIGYVDDHSITLPPLDEEEAVFHSATERSLSPDKAMEFLGLGGNFPGTSPSHKNITLSSHGFRRNIAPLKFPDLNEYSEDNKSLIPPSGQQPHPSQQPPPKTIGETSANKPHLPPHGDQDSDTQGSASSIGDKEELTLPPIPKRLVPSRSTERIMALLTQQGLATSYGTPEETQNRSSNHQESEEKIREEPLSSTPATRSKPNPQIGVSLEGDRSSLASVLSLPEGTFLGDARHKDGSLMAIVFQLKRVSLDDGQDIYCMWLSRDIDMERARTADLSMSMNRCSLDPYSQNVAVSPEVGLASGADSTDGTGPSNLHPHHPAFLQTPQSEEVLAVEGEYANNYSTLNPIGKGAFGFVKVAKKLDDGQMVVVKFLRKASVLKDCWVEDDEMGSVPLEIALLARLQHDNIIQLLEAYENEHFFQMVMEKHGEGLDLFEFIERSPRLTEQHISYIFRQMVSSIAYLHGMGIVHRDIKDENIIINQLFHIKLIDFGSAAHMGPSKKFNTFCGTLEYCSPEVLLGNSYSGPELEMWAVGVTLYTLVFGENPFFDVEETIAGHLQPPFLTSPGLMKVLLWLLHPDPRSRATIPDLLLDKWTNQHVDPALMQFSVVLSCPGDGENDSGAGAATAQATSGKGRGKAIKSNSEGAGTVPFSNAL